MNLGRLVKLKKMKKIEVYDLNYVGESWKYFYK